MSRERDQLKFDRIRENVKRYAAQMSDKDRERYRRMVPPISGSVRDSDSESPEKSKGKSDQVEPA